MSDEIRDEPLGEDELDHTATDEVRWEPASDVPDDADGPAAAPAVPERADEPRRKPTGREVAVVAGRTTAGVVVAAIAAGVAFGSTFFVPPTWSATAPSLAAVPTAAPQQLVCPGGLLRLATDTGEGASTASPIGAPWTAWAADTSVALRDIAGTNAGTLGTPAAAEIGTVAVADSGAPSAAGLQTEIVAAGIDGLAAAACAAPASEQWLVAGATTLGRTSLLILTNPSAVEAVVDIELYSEDGRVAAAGLSGVRLAPDEQRVLPLNGFAVDIVAPVIRVVSSGGRVVAAVQQSIVRSLATGGVDVVAAQRPATSLVIPGVRAQARGELAALDVQEIDHDDISTVLRLFAPGATEVTATVAIFPEGATLAEALAVDETVDAEAPGDAHADHEGEDADEPEPYSIRLTLTPGLVTEHVLELLPAGDYTIVVAAEQPIVGAVRNSTLAAGAAGAAPRVDFAWASPAAPLADRAVLALPRLADGTGGVPGVAASAPAQPTTTPPGGAFLGYLLWLVNPGDTAATATVTIEGEAPRSVELAPGSAAWVQLPAESTVALDGVRGLSAALLVVGPGLNAQAPLQPPAQLASEVVVRF